MKNISIIYDDRLKPGSEIREITGEKSFGRVIFKRRSLREIFSAAAAEALEGIKNTGDIKVWDSLSLSYSDVPLQSAVVLVFSDCIIKDKDEFAIILKKAGYSERSYRVMADDNVAAIVYESAETFTKEALMKEGPEDIKKAALSLGAIESPAFLDISGHDAFLSFITGGFEARFFNSLSGDEFTVIKKSSNKEKIHAEYKFYYLLPEKMRSWFVLPYDYSEDGNLASYKMQRYHMTDLSLRYVHGAISKEEFKRLLDILFVFLSERTEKRVTWNEFYEMRRDLYINKVEKRIGELKADPGYPVIKNYIVSGTDYSGIDEIVKRYEDLYDGMIGKNTEKLVKVVSHGDLCFSNILYSPDAQLLRLIDPRGAEKEEDIYSDPLYDYAKLSHSIAGQYDFMNSALFGIEVGEDMKLSLTIDSDVDEYRKIFEEKLKEAGIDVKTVRLFECSLFLSMLPLHMDRPQKVMAFILNAIKIMDEL